MAREDRYRRTATIKRQSSASDGYGGLTISEAVVATGYNFFEWNVTPFDREAIVTRYSLESNAVIYFAEGEWSDDIQNLDVLDVDADTRFRVIGTEPQYGMDNDTPDAISMVLERAGARP